MNAFLKKKNHKKLREQAENWLRLAEKVYHFRRDIIDEDDMRELHKASDSLNKALKKKGEEDWGKVRLASEELEAVLKRPNVGGYFYPQSFWAENAEMFLVAAIVALAIRTFFLQPFKIPTNSMYPTYNGMTEEVFEPGEAPGGIAKMFRFLAWGAVRREVVTEHSGELFIPLSGKQFIAQEVRGRKWFIVPANRAQFSLRVGDGVADFVVPPDFDPRRTFKKAFFPDAEEDWDQLIDRLRSEGKVLSDGRFDYVRTGLKFERGDTVLSFDVMTGDALFVDRFSYHFKRPDVGEAIVFTTEQIQNIRENKYYIKRLVGTPGDELQLKAPALYRNGELIEGAGAFEKNAQQDGEYPGYTNVRSWRHLRTPEDSVEIPEDSYFALGDNSPYSSDSRYWGFVPKREMVGKAILIYYPFSNRWGLAK